MRELLSWDSWGTARGFFFTLPRSVPALGLGTAVPPPVTHCRDKVWGWGGTEGLSSAPSHVLLLPGGTRAVLVLESCRAGLAELGGENTEKLFQSPWKLSGQLIKEIKPPQMLLGAW